ncbi:hypothetical protein [Mesorhizobium sp. A623]
MDYSLTDLLGDEPPPVALPKIVHESQLAALLGVSRQTICDQVRSGILERVAPARFDLAASVKSYCAHLRTHAARAGRPSEAGDAYKVARTAKMRADTELAEIKAAHARGELVSAAEVTRQWETALTDIRAALLAIPGRLQGIDRDVLTRIDGEVRAVLLELADNG